MRIPWMGLMIGAWLLAGFAAGEPTWDEEFLGPFPSWLDVKRDFGAVGDGKADDTEALQKALDSVGNQALGKNAIWLPAGTYRITRTLVRTGVSGVFLIGEHPETTAIRWDGPAYDGAPRVPAFNSPEWKAWDGRHPAEMLWFNGMNSRFERLTFDGAGKAASGFAFKWHSSEAKDQSPSHRISLADVVFKDMAIGFDGGGKQCWLDSEVLFKRCRFVRCSQFGVGLHHFNSVDYWLWHCTFEDCGVGVSNEPAHGGVAHVYESLFVRSKEADFTIWHAGFFALRHNVSIGSRRFFHAKNNGPNGASIHLQGNRVLSPLESDALVFETLGNIQLTDNLVISGSGATGPVVRAEVSQAGAPPWEGNSNHFDNGWAPVSLSMIGNTFTVSNPVTVRGRLLDWETRVLPGMEVRTTTELPGVLPRRNRRVFEVPAGADGAAIQAAIDGAAALAKAEPGAWPVVHLPHGNYPVSRTLEIPAGARIQVCGDGVYNLGTPAGTLLRWTDESGTGPVLRIRGPAKARLRDFGIITAEPWYRTNATLKTERPTGLDRIPAPSLEAAIVAEGIDQEGGRVHLDECNPNGLFGVGMLVEGLDWTFVQIIACEGTGLTGAWNRKWDGQVWDDPWAPYPAIRVAGGPLAKAGKDVPGVLVQGGDTGRWDVRDGGKLVVRDSWYECNWAPFHMRLRGAGRLTLDSGLDAQYTHPTLKGVGVGYLFDGWKGRFTSINIGFDDFAGNPLLAFTNDCRGGKVLFIGGRGHKEDPGLLPKAGDGAELIDLNRWLGKVPIPNREPLPKENALDLLRDARETRIQPLTPTPDGATDLRLSRIWTWNGRVGLHLKK